MKGEQYHKTFQDTDCKYDFQKTPQSHRYGFKNYPNLDFDHRYKLIPSVPSRLSTITDDVNESLIFTPYNVITLKMATSNNRTLRRLYFESLPL